MSVIKQPALISIRTRLIAVYAAIIVVGFSALTVFAGGQMTSAVSTDYEAHLQIEIGIIANSLARSSTPLLKQRSSGSGVEAVSRADSADLLKPYEDNLGGQLTLYLLPQQLQVQVPAGHNGQYPLPSQGEGIVPVRGLGPVLDNAAVPAYGQPVNGAPGYAFFTTPELAVALRCETILVQRTNAAGQDTLYTAAAIQQNQWVMALIQGAVPTANLQNVIAQRWLILFLGFTALTSVAVLTGLALSRSIIRPLYRLRESALLLSTGDFSSRVSWERQDEIGEVARAFNEMASQVQKMLEEQRAFASNTAHELRTPLTAIRLRTEALLYDATLDAGTSRQYVEEIDHEIATLGNLVQDLTLLARFDAGRAELGDNQIDCNRLALSLSEQFAAQADEKRIHLSINPCGQPTTIKASLSHLTVVFRNLLDNALKYTPEGGSISWRIEATQDGTLHTIRDNGQGIAHQDLPLIFERFYRADKAHSRDIPGTGLGLALVRTIVESYGGQITVSSDGAGQGTTVTVLWPQSPAAPAA